LGGKKNIQSVDAVALTRLRVKVIDNNLVDEDKLKTAGVEGILRLPDGILHLLVGLGAEQYAAQIQD
jgi:phosphotransferase system IIB component